MAVLKYKNSDGTWITASDLGATELPNVIPIEMGGTGATTVEGALANLGLDNLGDGSSGEQDVKVYNVMTSVPWFTSGMSTKEFFDAMPRNTSIVVKYNKNNGTLSDAPADFCSIQFNRIEDYRTAIAVSVTGNSMFTFHQHDASDGTQKWQKAMLGDTKAVISPMVYQYAGDFSWWRSGMSTAEFIEAMPANSSYILTASADGAFSDAVTTYGYYALFKGMNDNYRFGFAWSANANTPSFWVYSANGSGAGAWERCMTAANFSLSGTTLTITTT